MTACNDRSFHLDPGSVTVLLGPNGAGKIVKQLVQILFIYFGLLPDIAIMAVGLIFHHGAIAAVACAVFNVLLGLLFFGLTPLFLVPDNG